MDLAPSTLTENHVNRGDEASDFWFKLPEQSVATRRETKQANRNLHKHDFIELVIVFSGTGSHITEGTRYSIKAGDIFVILPGIRHAYADTDHLSLINILIRKQHLQALEREFIGMPGFDALFKLEPRLRVIGQIRSQLRLTAQALADINDWIVSLEAASNQATQIACSRARAFLQLIVGNLCFHYQEIASVDSTKLLQIASCIRYMDGHMESPLHLSDLAREAGMSERSLSRSFHASVGQSPIEYLLNMRLQRASELLLASPASIAQIAFEVGFGDANYFTRQFRRFKGISPRDYRKKHQAS